MWIVFMIGALAIGIKALQFSTGTWHSDNRKELLRYEEYLRNLTPADTERQKAAGGKAISLALKLRRRFK